MTAEATIPLTINNGALTIAATAGETLSKRFP